MKSFPTAFPIGGASHMGGGGSISVTSLDLSSMGVFSRSTVGTYWTKAATDGSSAFLASAAANVRRMEDRGDGNGTMLLMEGSRINLLTYSEDFLNVSTNAWSFFGTATSTTGQPSPDGTSNGTRVQAASGTNGLGELTGNTMSAGYVTISCFVRSTSGSGASNFNLFRATDGRLAISTAPTTTFQRLSKSATLGTSQQTSMVLVDGRDWSAIGGVVAGARDHIVWGAQREANAYASSYVLCSHFVTTRGADSLALPMYQCAWMNTAVQWAFDYAPICSSADFINENAEQVLWSFAEDSSEKISLIVSAGTACIRVTSGGVTKVTSGAITFSAHQKLTITANKGAGSIAVAGATTGNGTTTGTSWTFPYANPTVYVGAVKTGATPAFGRYGSHVGPA